MIWIIILPSPFTYFPFRKSPPVPLTLASWVPPVSVVIVVVVVSMVASPSPFLEVLVTFLTFLIPATPVAADILPVSALQIFQTETVQSLAAELLKRGAGQPRAIMEEPFCTRNFPGCAPFLPPLA